MQRVARCFKKSDSLSSHNKNSLMDKIDIELERIVITAIKIGTITTLNKLGLINEMVTAAEAEKLYSKKLIDEWRSKRWIVGYPSGNAKRARYYFKRSELELASCMLDLKSSIPENRIFKYLK